MSLKLHTNIITSDAGPRIHLDAILLVLSVVDPNHFTP